MAQWYEITRSDKYKSLNDEQKSELKQYFFERRILPKLQSDPEFSGNQKALNFAFQDFMQTPDDTGQGYVSSMLGAAGRGFGEVVPGAIEGVGALTGSEGLREFGQDVRGGLEDISRVNPIYGESIPVKLSELGGQIGSVLATAGAGGLAGKALGGVGAATTGMRAAPLASAFLQGSAEGARQAEEYGMTGPEAYLRTLAGGATEAGTELLPFGMAAETALAKRVLTGAPRTGTFLGAVGSEAGEEGLGQIASNIATQALAPTGVETPGITEGALEAAAYGAAGGGMLGGVNALISTPPEKQTQIQKDLQAEAGAIPKDTVPDQTNEEKMAAMEKGGITVVSPDGKTAVIAPEELSMPDPAAVAKTIGEASVENLAATGNEASAAAQADFNAILAETLGETPKSTIQPEQAVEEVGAEVTPSLETEMLEKSSQTITGSNGEIAPEMPVQPTAGEAIQPPTIEPQDNAPRPIQIQESLPEEPQDRVESRKAEETGVGDQLRGAATGEVQGEVIDPEMQELQELALRRGQAQNKVKGIKFTKKDEARFKKLSKKLGPQLRETVDPQSDPIVGEDINDQPIRQSPRGTYYTFENGRVRTGPAFKEPITPPGGPTTATEGMVTPGGVATERDATEGRLYTIYTTKGKDGKGKHYIPNLAPMTHSEALAFRKSQTDPAKWGLEEVTSQFTQESADQKRAEKGMQSVPVLTQTTKAAAPKEEASPSQGELTLEETPKQSASRIKKAMIRFASGMSAIGDLRKGTYARASHKNYGVGFDVGLLSKNAINELAQIILNLKTQFFIDSGAFSNFKKAIKAPATGKKVESLDFDKILAKYDSIIDAIGQSNEIEETDYPRPMLVMPDVIGNQAESLALIEKYKNWIALEVSNNTSIPIIPIPLGELPLSQAYNRILEILGSNTLGIKIDPRRFVVGVPSNAEAISRDDLAKFLSESKPPHIHFLGAAADQNINPLIDVVAENSPTTQVTADASKIRSAILNGVAKGKTRNQAIFDALYQEDDPLVILDSIKNESPQTKQAAETQTPVPLREGTGAAGVVQSESAEGSISAVGKVSPKTESESRENLGPKAAAAKKKQAAADEAAKKRQEKQDNATKSSLNSVVGPQKEDAIQGTVTKVDVETAREALTNSGEIPNAYLTNVYESLEAFLADKANARLFPSAYARLQTEKNIEGLYENGQTLIFAKQIQVSNLDRNLATMLGLTPEQAAARRVIAHENGHKAISLFTMAEKRELRGYLMRAYSDEQIAKLVETYDEYADWRTNLESRFEALEELLMRDFEKMEQIPTGGVWDDIVQFLKRVWRRLTGQKGEPTLKNLKDVARLMRNAMKRPAVPLGSFTLKDGGKVKLSFIGEKAIENLPTPTPVIDIRKLNAEYLAAVEAGDSGNDNLNQLLRDASPDERQAVVDSWIERNPWTATKIQRMVKEMAKARGYDIEAYHGSSAENDFNVFDAEKILNEGAGVGFYFALDKRLAQEYANKFPKGKVFHVFLKQSTPLKTEVEYPSTPSNDLEAFNNTVEAITKYGQLSSFERQALKESLSQLGAAPNLLSDPSYFQTGLRAFFDSKEFQNFNLRSKAYLLSLYEILAGKMGKQWSLDTIGLLTRMDGLRFTDPGVFTVLRPNQIKSANPVTYDDAGNVIPPSQRFQTTSPDIRFSRPQFASDTDAATSAGNEAARSTIYSERDMDVREAIRRAYEAMSKDTSLAVPIGELFAKTEELMPGVTQDEFSNVLQDLFEDNGAVLQEGEQIIPEQEVEIQAFEKDNPFNELIRKSTEKSPSLGEINGVSKKFVQRVLRPASNFATNNGIRIDDNAPLQVRAMPDGSIIIGYSLSQERFDELQKMAPQAASQYTKDSVIEELIHLSDLIGLRNQWIKSGKKISFDQFVLGEQSNLAFSLIQKADSLNDLEAESLRRILASSLSLYNNNPEIANLSLNELLDLAAQYPYVLPELVRSLIQLKKTGQLTETAFRKIANVLREWQEIVLQWISDGYASAKEGVFGEMLSERIKNAENNLAQFSDTSEINVTTPEGRRAGFVVVMPRAAKASKIPIEDAEEASKSFKVDLAEAGKGRVDKKAKFKGKLLKDTEIPEHNVKSYVLYRDPAIKLIDDLMAKTNDILVVAEALQDPEFQIAVGLQVSKDVSSDMITIARNQIGIEIENRLANEIRKERNPRRKRELELAEKRGIIYYNAGTGAGQALQNRQESLTDPRYRGRNLFNQAKLQKEQKSKDKLDAITGGTEKITDIITKAEEKAAEETTQAEVEAQESAAEDDEYAKLVSEGEEGLEGRRKTIWEMAKMILRRLAMYARADKLDIKTGSKASLSAEQRKEIDELNAILRMPKAERDKAREKDLAEFDALMTEFLGLDSEAKTPEQKKTRQKRVKMIDVVRKYAESGRSIDLADQQTALKGMLREMNKARPADSVPLERAMPWRKILSSNPKGVAEYRQRIFEAISDLPSFQNLTDEQKERLADLYAEAWENRKQTILDRMLRDEIKKARDRDEISEDVEKKLQQSRNKILEIVNLGGFNNDDLVRVLGERYGISTSFTEEQKERIQKLADQLQDEDMNTAKRNKLAMEFAVELAGAMDVPVSEIISNWWTSSVLFGPQTIFSIGAAFLNGGYSIATIGTRRMLAKLVKGDIQGAIEESILMLKGFARYLGAFKQSGRRAWSYLWTGDVGLLGTGSTDILSEINNFDQLQRFQRHKLLAEKLAKDPRMVRRYVGVYLRFVSRLLTALDAFNVMVTKAGTASLALRMSGMSTDKIIEAEKMLNLKAYKDQVIRNYFDNKAPTTLHGKGLVDSFAEAEMYRAINKLGGKMENADYLASESAMTMHPTGFGGVVYDAITGFFAQRQSNADEYLEKMKKDWISHKDLKAVTFLSLAYLRQFAAYNAAGLTGSKFVRYASNKFNQGLSFIPFAGLLRQIEAKDDRIKGKDAFRETIYRNQIVSFVMLMVGYSVIKAIQDEPDDEERGNFWNGGWANLTPDQKKQMLAKGQKEYTMGFKFNGRWYVFNYQNWPLNQILSAIGSMSDQVRFSPEKWDEKSALSKGVAGMVSGVKSTLEIPALSGLQDLVGNRLASKDPTERDLDRLSRVASGWVGGFVPRILKDIDFYTQPELRKYEGLWEKTASHIPIYRRYVGEEYYDILGQQIKRNVIPGSREFMMGPTEPEYKILGALNARNIFLTPANAEYRMVGKGRNRRRLTQEEADAYSLETGRGYRDMLLRYGQRALQMPTERARAFLQDKADEVRDRALKRAYRR